LSIFFAQITRPTQTLYDTDLPQPPTSENFQHKPATE
jgi:hypothetical protein